MADGWYVKRGDQKYGPYSTTQLVEMAKKGQVLPLDWVARGESTQWMPASQVQGLFEAPEAAALPAATPAPPPLPPAAVASPPPASVPAQASSKLLGMIPIQVAPPIIGMSAVVFLALLASFFCGSFLVFFFSFLHNAGAVACIVLTMRLQKSLFALIATLLTMTAWGWLCFTAVPAVVSILGLLVGIAVAIWALFAFFVPDTRRQFADPSLPARLARLPFPALAGILGGGSLTLILGIGMVLSLTTGPNKSGGRGTKATWEKAIRVSGADEPKWEGGKPPIPGSRDDFLAAMELMGGNRGHTFQEKGITKVQMAFKCDEQKWHEVFGKPELLSDGYDTFIRQHYQRWKHKLSDGPLTLTGNLYVHQGTRYYQSMQAWFD